MLDVLQDRHHLFIFTAREIAQALSNPCFVGLSHFRKTLLARPRQGDTKSPAVIRHRLAANEPLSFQLHSNPRDITARHHHPLRKVTHRQSLRFAGQLRHEIKPWECDIELSSQTVPQVPLDEIGAGEQPQP